MATETETENTTEDIQSEAASEAANAVRALRGVDSGTRAAVDSLSAGGRREISVASLIHLMGLPSQAQVGVVEQQLDQLNGRIVALQQKMDRLTNQLNGQSAELYLDRIDFQLSEIRNVIKKVFSQAMASQGIAFESEDSGKGSSRNSSVQEAAE